MIDDEHAGLLLEALTEMRGRLRTRPAQRVFRAVLLALAPLRSHEAMVFALDQATRHEALEPETRVAIAAAILSDCFPGASLRALPAAVEMWPHTKRKAARAAAVLALARDLGLESKTLNVQLRAARSRLTKKRQERARRK